MRILLLLLITILPNLAKAQDILISDEINIANYSSYFLIGEIEDNTFLLVQNDRKYEILAFGANLRKAWDREVEMVSKRCEVLHIHMIPGDSTFTMFYTSRAKGKNMLMADTYSNSIVLQERDTLIDKKTDFNSFDFVVDWSSDKSKLLFVEILTGGKYRPVVYDYKRREKMLDIGKIDYKVDWASNEYFLVTNLGEVVYIGVDKFSKRSRGCEIYKHALNEEITKFEFAFTKFINVGEIISYDNLNQNLVVAGIYTDQKLDRAEGTYFISINMNSGKLMVAEKEPFDVQFLMKYDNKSRKPRKGLTNIALSKIIHFKDGGIMLLGEESRVLTRATSNNGSPVGIEYNYDEIFAINYNGSGRLRWQEVFPKRQYSYGDSGFYSGFFVMESSNFLRLLFNDEIRPVTTVSEFILSGNGSFWRNSVMSTEDLDVLVRFKSGVQNSSKSATFPSETRGRLKLVKLIY